jgi:IMP dehydrogenase/GMP reductase
MNETVFFKTLNNYFFIFIEEKPLKKRLTTMAKDSIVTMKYIGCESEKSLKQKNLSKN